MNIIKEHTSPTDAALVAHAEPTAFVQPTSFRVRLLEPFRDSIFGLGLLLLAASWITFSMYDLFGGTRRESGINVTMIMVHYGLAVTFSIVLLVNGFLKFRRQTYPEGRPARWVGLLLWLISAHALNRELAVFQQSTAWLCWALVFVGIAMTAYAWKESLSIRAQQLLYATLAFGCWLFAYMAIYVAELYPISFPMLIGLGLSAHTFVPILFAITLGKRLWQDTKQEEHLRLGVHIGLAVPLVVIIIFSSGWIRDLNRIERTRQQSTIRKTSDLPDWVLLAQQLNPNHPVFGWVTDRLLRSNRVFDRGRFFDGDGWGMSGLTALDAIRQHDPLVVIASRLFPADVLSDGEHLALLKVLSGERHGSEEKFWTGRHLTTQDVVSQVRIWPQFRVSYTEQTFRIRNQARNTTEEALLTFHLPAGSVVSAMSLWVNGREEPARLTTVAKADSAYRQVVAIESRAFAHDPSVVYWQEGNRVTVRVFPCRAGEDRRVKLGVTSPLQLIGNQLVYQVPYVEGPSAASTDELIHVDFSVAPTALKTTWLFDGMQGNTLTHEGRYNPDWTLRFQSLPLSSDAFVLNQRTYQVETYKLTNEPFRPTEVYLDVNKAWQKEEYVSAFQLAVNQRHCRVWVFDDGLKQLNEANLEATYERLHHQAFSLFPIYRIANPTTALLITKGTPLSPTLSDLKGSPFADRFAQLATQAASIRTFCLTQSSDESGLPTYLKTLAELRVLNVTQGNHGVLTNYLKNGQFPRQPDGSESIAFPEAGMVIRATPQQPARASAAPDHLARLFTYNHLLAQIGSHYFAGNYQTDALIQEAQQAHIVSPLSSLVVLETERDYDRFGIKKDASGLDNATLKEEGAVPEPHEWALLLVLAGLIGWLYWRKNYALH